MTIKEALLPEFDQEMANTRKTLERVPEDKFGWKPHAKSFSMGSLATHIVVMTGWTVDTMKKDSFDISPPGAPPYKEEPATSRAQLLERFDKSVAEARAAIQGASDEVFLKNWSLLAEYAFYDAAVQLCSFLRDESRDSSSGAAGRVFAIE